MRRIIAIATAGVVILVLVVAQLVLPGIAADRLRDRLGKSGNVISVEVHAFPAIKLLWNHADRVVVRMGSYRSSTGPLGSLLSETSNVGSLDASAAEFDSGLLTVRNAALRKRGDQLVGTRAGHRSRPAPVHPDPAVGRAGCARRTGASRSGGPRPCSA